jgi:hypothetical protein
VIRVSLRSKLASIVLTFLSLSGCGANNASVDSASISDGSLPVSASYYCGSQAGTSNDITIAWDAPIEYSDKSPLYFSDISGFRIYIGTAPERYNHIISVNDPATTSCSIPVSASGTYYIAMTVITKDGLESDYSNEVTRSL